jgi:deoxycytidylate deaminase
VTNTGRHGAQANKIDRCVRLPNTVHCGAGPDFVCSPYKRKDEDGAHRRARYDRWPAWGRIHPHPFEMEMTMPTTLGDAKQWPIASGKATSETMPTRGKSMSELTIVSSIGPTAEPPIWAVEAALDAATLSPCQKRKVGIAIYRCVRGLDGGREVALETSAIGYNGPPRTWTDDERGPDGACDNSEACRRDCAKRCVHAEPRAIDDAMIAHSGTRLQPHLLRMVHVKLADGKLMPCDGPSCIECSKQILDRGIGGIWLFEAGFVRDVDRETGRPGPARWHYYTALDFHEATMARLGIHQGSR